MVTLQCPLQRVLRPQHGETEARQGDEAVGGAAGVRSQLFWGPGSILPAQGPCLQPQARGSPAAKSLTKPQRRCLIAGGIRPGSTERFGFGYRDLGGGSLLTQPWGLELLRASPGAVPPETMSPKRGRGGLGRELGATAQVAAARGVVSSRSPLSGISSSPSGWRLNDSWPGEEEERRARGGLINDLRGRHAPGAKC